MKDELFYDMVQPFIISELSQSSSIFSLQHPDSFLFQKQVTFLSWGFEHNPQFFEIFLTQIVPQIVSEPQLSSLTGNHFKNIESIPTFLGNISKCKHPLHTLILELQDFHFLSIPNSINISDLNTFMLCLNLQPLHIIYDFIVSKFPSIFSLNNIFNADSCFLSENQNDIMISIRAFIFNLLYQFINLDLISFLNDLFSFVSITFSHQPLLYELIFHCCQIFIYCFKTDLHTDIIIFFFYCI